MNGGLLAEKTMIQRLEAIRKRYEELSGLMAQPEVAADHARLQRLAREQAELERLASPYERYKETQKSLDDTLALLGEKLEPEMEEMAREELARLRTRLAAVEREIKQALLPTDPNDQRDVIVEIRAGTGGEEAALFAADLFRMYARYAAVKGWDVEVLSRTESGIGGFKEIILEVHGRGAFSRLKYERGVHRVQRVPVTEASGRIHTSTATVAVLPEAEEVEVDITPDDLRVDIFHSGGAGGQNVNKVATAVRLTHLPTGMVVTCQDERSQLKNRTKAMAVLRARLLAQERDRQAEEMTQARRAQVGTGERAEKIRSYNFPQDRVSDHRIGGNFHNIPAILNGEIDEIIDAVATSEQARELEKALA